MRGVIGALNKPSPESPIPAGEFVPRPVEARGEGTLMSALFCSIPPGDDATVEGDEAEVYSCRPRIGSPWGVGWGGENKGESPVPIAFGRGDSGSPTGS